jgi:hypothetical protein
MATTLSDSMFYIPSPIRLVYDIAYLAKANASGRMQYYRIIPGKSRERIGRADFIEVYNSGNIIAMRPVQERSTNGLFQIEFYVIDRAS